jgi:O-methyltransferase
VAFKERVNSGLTKLTGYRLVRAGGDGNGAAAKPAPTPEPEPAPKPKKDFPDDYDDAGKDIIRAVRPYTMTSHEKLYALILAVRYAHAHGIPGDIVECGVWRGGSMHAAARTLDALGDTSRDLHLFDTFDGMPPPTEKDLRHDGTPAADLLAIRPRDHDVWAVATLDDVRDGFAEVPYPSERVHFHKGMVEETIPAAAPEQIAILRLDTDWYESTRHELEHLYPRLSRGGVLLIDDYGWWKGSREAVHEFLEESGERLLLLRMASGRIAVKP